jgi:hypothetical protein
MDKTIQDALLGTLLGFQSGTNQILPEKPLLDTKNEVVYQELIRIFSLEKDFMEKVEALDSLIHHHPGFNSIQEFLFDLLMINFFSSDQDRYEEDYLESPAWQEIEDETIDRGTEMLNLFLYLRECKEEGIEPGLSDYLDEFLLVEEEDFQDEHEIYEDVIAHQVLMESSYSEIARVASQLSESSPMKEVFNPLMGYFLNPEPSTQELDAFLSQSTYKAFDCAVLFAILMYYAGKEDFPIR